MELKLNLLFVFLDHFLYKDTDHLVEVLHKLAIRADEPEGMLVCNLNPFMLLALIKKLINTL
jgi:hypothetical protein